MRMQSGRRRAGVAALLALGASLARRGPLALVSTAVSVLTALVLCAVAFAFARRGGDAPVQSMPILASSALAWGGGFLHAVAISAGALRRDRAEGIRHLGDIAGDLDGEHGHLLVAELERVGHADDLQDAALLETNDSPSRAAGGEPDQVAQLCVAQAPVAL